jgi:ubiquinone/menaquinone biosynthesis C-methylase UbiE
MQDAMGKSGSKRRAALSDYVHGYSNREAVRLVDQATTLTDLLHHDTAYPAGSLVLEAGCGVGAQTVTLAQNSPGAHITSIDVSEESLAAARDRVRAAGLSNVAFRQADILHLPFPPSSFDHVFVCFVLEHVTRPQAALRALKDMLKPGGTITVIEGDHGSAYFHPDDADARRAITCLIELQAQQGGDSLVGRRVFPLLTSAGFQDVRVSPRLVHVDDSRPELVEGFTLNTFTAMVEGVRERALAAGMIDPQTWERGVTALRRTAGQGGTFCYTFFKGMAVA